MTCPRCSLVDIPDGAEACVVCGYAPSGAAAETAPAVTELDARRELAHEFRIDAVVHPGPATIVYLAYDPHQGGPVALKAVLRGPLRNAGVEDQFRRAADAAAALDHPHIIPIHRSGATANFLWYTTKHVEGRSIDAMLRTGGAIELGVCLRILEQVASALDYTHRRGVCHGALSSGNVVIDPNAWVLVADFAVAAVLATERSGAEPLQARYPTPSADQYSLAALCYECLSGAPFTDASSPRLADVRPELSPYVSEALRRALSKRPTDRFPSVLDFTAAMAGTAPAQRGPLFSLNPRRSPGAPVVIMDDDEPRQRGRRRFAAAGVAIALGAGSVWLGLSSLPAALSIQRRVADPPATAPAAAPLPPSPTSPAAPLASAPPAPPEAPPAASGSRVERAPTPRSPVQRAPPRPAPRPPPPTTMKQPGPTPYTSRARQREPGRLSINAIPWGNVYVDGHLIGNTPLTEIPIWPGMHSLRVEREGFRPYERSFTATPGQRLRITDIVLRELAP